MKIQAAKDTDICFVLRAKFFKNEVPVHDTFCVQMLVREVFVVGVDCELLSKEDIAELFESFYYGK